MKSLMHDISEFHRKFELSYDGEPRSLDSALMDFRVGFMQEELDEFSDAWNEGDIEKQFDALIDLIYVAVGTAYLMGGSANIAKDPSVKYQAMFSTMWNRVHTANMTKIRTANKEDSKRGSTFDVVKPEGWQAPDFSDLLQTAYENTYPMMNISEEII